VAYEHFTKVNYAAVVEAQVRHALKEISDDELERVRHPPAATLDKTNSVANRYFRLAGRQFAATNYVQALASIQKNLDQKPTAAAYTLQGKILAAQGKTNEARAAFEAALKLDPHEADADAGLKLMR
jgi:predicted negative regulator of RcsB-dependent stress response